MVKASRRSRTRHSKKTKTRRHRKSHSRRRHATRKTRGGTTRCFDARGNPDSDGLYNVDGSRNSNCPIV